MPYLAHHNVSNKIKTLVRKKIWIACHYVHFDHESNGHEVHNANHDDLPEWEWPEKGLFGDYLHG